MNVVDEQDDIVRTMASQSPTGAAFVMEGGDRWTFGRLDEEAGRLASAWSDFVPAGSSILIYAPNAASFIVGMSTAWRLGAIPVLLNHLYDSAEVERVLTHVRPALAIWSDGSRARPGDLGTPVQISDQRREGSQEFD